MSFDQVLLVIAALLGLSVLASKAATKLGIPVLLVFIGIGMLAGSDGPGGIWFSNHQLAQQLGITALAFILFSGGMDTDWSSAKKYLAPSSSLATMGVLATAGMVGLMAHLALGFSVLEGLLLGSIVACTDAAAVFGTLRGAGIQLGHKIQSILELESGFNDPMAVFLTIAFTQALVSPEPITWVLLPMFLLEMVLGAAWGYLNARGAVVIMQKIRLEFEAMYQVVSIALVLGAYAGAEAIHGNGFLSVYIAGLTFGSIAFPQRKGLSRFHDGLSWLMQITMFIVLGLLVFPRELGKVAGLGLAVSAVVMFLARPIGVLIALTPFRVDTRGQALVAWGGLRGAAPIVLATFPLLAKVPRAQTIFDIVFFIVLFSSLLQGTTLSWVARKLGIGDQPPTASTGTPPTLATPKK